METDPFGNLRDWGPTLELFNELAENNKLAECQPGLIRILHYKGNWRLREEVLKRIGQIQTPSRELIAIVFAIMADDNIYYDARILASDALTQLLKGLQADLFDEICDEIRKVVEKLRSTPKPPFFDEALKRLYSKVGLSTILEN